MDKFLASLQSTEVKNLLIICCIFLLLVVYNFVQKCVERSNKEKEESDNNEK